MNGHECYIIGAGDFFGLREAPDDSDYVIAADAGFEYCTENCIIPDLVLGDFDSLGKAPKHPNVLQLPVEKDDTDTLAAVKLGLERLHLRRPRRQAPGSHHCEHAGASVSFKPRRARLALRRKLRLDSHKKFLAAH